MKHRPSPVRDNSSSINNTPFVGTKRNGAVQIPIKRIDRSGPKSKDVNRLFHPWCMCRGLNLCAFLASQNDLDPHNKPIWWTKASGKALISMTKKLDKTILLLAKCRNPAEIRPENKT